MWDAGGRWRQGEVVSRVEVWSQNTQVGTVDQSGLVDGTVQDKYGTGIRRSLSMTVEPSAKWLRWAKLPGLELRVFSGFNWGRSESLCPMGVFPVLPPSISLPASGVSISNDDYWSWVVGNDLAPGRPSYSGGPVTYAVKLLILESKAGTHRAGVEVDVRSISQERVPAMVWDKTAHDAIKDALAPFNLEAFMDRQGVPVIQDISNPPGPSFAAGVNVISISQDTDWADVQNGITVVPSNNDIFFDPVTSVILDANHPAHDSKIGRRGFVYSSPYFTERWQAVQAAPALLAKKASPALGWKVTALPDARVDSGDLVHCKTDLGDVTAIVQQVTHSLVGDAMQLTLGAV